MKTHYFSAADYYDLGLKLGLLAPELDSIRKTERGDVDDCLKAVLNKWLKTNKGTLGQLVEALESINKAAADGIRRARPQ